ncbi:NTP transferase domain-containing protein [Alphaproteobacteria bacterium]|nr:NTP transferase domain-containing protein [Alphaproteobacteria bacterium]
MDKNDNELVIVLAAGMGSRLKSVTYNQPKCLVPISGNSLLSLSIKQMTKAGLENILIIGGYKSEVLEKRGYNVVLNSEFQYSNMVWSLTKAADYIDSVTSEYVIIHYGDIIVSYLNILALRHCENEFSVLADKQWKELWRLRMHNYLDDIETFKTKKNRVIELGKKVCDETQVEAQFMGVIRVKRKLLAKLLLEFKAEVANSVHGSQKLKNMFMTDFIQKYIENGGVVTPVFINGGWLELDTIEDLSLYESEKGVAHFKEILSG